MEKTIFVSYSFKDEKGCFGFGNASFKVTEKITYQTIQWMESRIKENSPNVPNRIQSVIIISWQEISE